MPTTRAWRRRGRVLAVAGCLAVAACSTASPPAKAPAGGAGSTFTPAQGAGAITGVYEVTGSGTAITIDIDPAGADGKTHFTSVALPWRRPFTLPAETQLIQVVVVGAAKAGCRILVDDEVVAEQPAGSAHCVYER